MELHAEVYGVHPGRVQGEHGQVHAFVGPSQNQLTSSSAPELPEGGQDDDDQVLQKAVAAILE